MSENLRAMTADYSSKASTPAGSASRIRSVLAIVWLVAMAVGLGMYVYYRDSLSAAGIAAFLQRFGPYMMVGYLGISITRAFFLIPSTPFVLAAGILLPGQPMVVLAISMIGIALSATGIYYFSDWLGFRAHFSRLSETAMNRLERVLSGPLGFVYLALWAFFPLAPTDAACYVAGMVRMRFWKFLAGVCLGELVICAVYVFAGQGLGRFFFGGGSS